MRIKKIEHVGIACRDLRKTAPFYREALGLPLVSEETLEEMRLRVVKVAVGESVLELLEPLEGETVISRFLEDHGEGFHHVCFAVEDLDEAMAHLRSHGYTPVWDTPKRGAGGRRVNFLRPKETGGILIELNEE